MLGLLLESSIRIALVIAVAAIALRAFGIRSATFRHAIWTVVTASMLLTPVLVQWGPAFRVPLLREHRMAPAPIVVLPKSAPPIKLGGEPVAVRVAPEATAAFPWQALPLAIYGLGATFLLLRLAVGMAQVQGLLAVSIVEGGRRVHPACKTPVTVGWLRPVMILPVAWHEWPIEQWRAVLTHEEQHIRRRDPLVQWVALLNRAIFWFHPLAWWLNRELAQLAEEACDEAVLSQGVTPGEYSSALLSLARVAHENAARIQLGTAMPGPALQARLCAILDGSRVQAVSRVKLACMALVVAAAVGIFSTGKVVRAQATAAFEVASIKPHPDPVRYIGVNISGTAVTVTAMTVRNMLTYAYDLLDFQVEGGEKWTTEERYTISARAPGDKAPTQNEVRAMLLTLLKERFHLRERRSSKELPIYALVVSPKGHRLKTPERPEDPERMTLNSPGREVTAKYWNASPAFLVKSFSFQRELDRPLVDQTGLTGKYDFEFKLMSGVDGTTGLAGESIFTALEEQLGLKLEPKKAQIDVHVIDHVERPTEN